MPRVLEARVIYHDGHNQAGVGIYDGGVLPWMDLLVRLGEDWYGPEREPDDGINALPLPPRYRWEAEGGFGILPNGEAWWTKLATEGTARLIEPTGKVILELPLRVIFRGSGEKGEKEPEPEPSSPPPPPLPT
jgi:hypothetical protein